MEASDPAAATNSWNPSHIIRNSHIKALFFLVPITWYSMSGFQQKKLQGIQKDEKKHSQINHQNQTKIEHRYWNYQTENLA